MADYELTQEDQARILNEEVKAFVEFSTAQLKDFCENGPPIPGRKTDPPGRFLSYMHDTLKTELMNVFDPDYLVKVKEGYALPPQQYVFYAADQGTPVAGPFPSPEEAMIAAQQMGLQPDMNGMPPIIQKQSFWAKIFMLPKDTDWTAWGYFSTDFKNLFEQFGRQMEARA